MIKHYTFSELRDFITRGRRDGNVGWLLMSKIDGISKYKGYGTIEHPCNDIRTIHMQHHPLFDDSNYPERQPMEQYNFVLLDLNGVNKLGS